MAMHENFSLDYSKRTIKVKEQVLNDQKKHGEDYAKFVKALNDFPTFKVKIIKEGTEKQKEHREKFGKANGAIKKEIMEAYVQKNGTDKQKAKYIDNAKKLSYAKRCAEFKKDFPNWEKG